MISIVGFKEWIAEQTITEMAFNKRKLEDKISGLEGPLNLHLIKVLKFKDEDNYLKHWKDIQNWIDDIQDWDYNSSGRKFTQKQYYNLLFVEPVTGINNISYLTNKYKGRLRDYTNLPVLNSDEEVMKTLHAFHVDLSTRLSKNDAWNISETYIY